MKTTFLIIALLWPNTESLQLPVYDNQANVMITKDFLTVKSVFSFKGHEWAPINKDSIKIGKNEFYYILEPGLAVELKIFRYD